MCSNLDAKSAFKLALLEGLTETSKIEIIKNILNQEGDINFAIPDNSPRQKEIGYTALHFACSKKNLPLFEILLNYGADFTKQNNDGQSVLHMLIKRKTEITKPSHNPYIDAVLSAHVKSKNASNPYNKDGLSHFHIACMTYNYEAVKIFLENEVLLDDSVNADSKNFPGYTALHFAVKCRSTNIAKILIAHGANVHIADANQMTPLHILIKHKMQLYDSIGQDSRNEVETEIQENDKIINILLENISTDNDCLDSIGLSNFHVACMLQEITIAEHLMGSVTDLNHCVHKDSPLWPGYTALHFAAHIDIKTVEILTDTGANLLAKDAKGLTPLDICIERYKIDDICDLMCYSLVCKNIVFSVSEIALLHVLRIFALKDESAYKDFLVDSAKDINMCIPMESPLWPGYTLLHLAVHFAEQSQPRFCINRETDLKLVTFCLKNGADLSKQDKRGQTALHLAFRLNKMRIVESLCRNHQRISNVHDEENLSHLHIICARDSTTHKLKKCVLKDSDVNAVYKGTTKINIIRPGSTPLHVSLISQGSGSIYDKIVYLLRFGADPHIKDASGLTPVHRLMEYFSKCGYYRNVMDELVAKVQNDCVAEEYGLSHLHVACHMYNEAAVKRFIKNGANVNLAIKCLKKNNDDSLLFLDKFDKCRPLHLITRYDSNLDQLLLEHGADVFAKNTNGSTHLSKPGALVCFLKNLKNNVKLQNRLKEEYGWTKLHLACNSVDIKGFKKLVKKELANVNVCVNLDSPVWKGYSSLHLLMYEYTKMSKNENILTDVFDMSKILLQNGVDVTIKDDKRNTPISILLESSIHNKLLMKYYKHYDVNSVLTQGMSYFHLACYFNDVDAVNKFLSKGVDVNHPIDFFSYWYPGFTPLHLTSDLQIVDLLIRHGADVNKDDLQGCSVLAEALSRNIFDKNIITKIVESGANIHSLSFNGKTSFEIVVSRKRLTMEKLEFFIKQGFKVNSCHPITGIGYMSIILASDLNDINLKMLCVERIMKEKSESTMGSTTLHHMVAGNVSNAYVDVYVNLFEKLIESGIDIDVQDTKGRTALHWASESGNRVATSVLLKFGADVNILDSNGFPAFTYANSHVQNEIIQHIYKLAYLKLNLGAINVGSMKYINTNCNWGAFMVRVETSKTMKIGVRSILLYDFLSENGAVIMYSKLTYIERCKIDEYFQEIGKNEKMDELEGVLKFQYRKAVKRIELLFLATKSLRFILGFDLPDLCAENIFQYLCNSDLKNIVHAE